jgi:hypothetical protein
MLLSKYLFYTSTKFVLKYFPVARPKSFKTPSLKLVKTPLPVDALFPFSKTKNFELVTPFCVGPRKMLLHLAGKLSKPLNVCAYECVVCARTLLLLFLFSCWLCCMQIQQRQIERRGQPERRRRLVLFWCVLIS